MVEPRGRAPGQPLAWEPVVEPWHKRILPGEGWGRAYVWGIVAVLLFIGALFVLNILVPIGDGLANGAATAGLLLLGWGLGLLVPYSFTLPALRPASVVAVPAIPLIVLLGVADVWDVGPESIGDLAGALIILLLFAALAGIPYHRLSQGIDVVPAGISILPIALGGIGLAAAIAGLDLDDRLVESLWRCATAFVFAALVLLIPVGRRRWPVWLSWAAVAQFAVVQGLDPWVDGARSGRLLAAGFVLVAVLGITALTLQLLPPRRTEA